MGAVTTPTGQVIWVPDTLPFPGLSAPEMPAPEAGATGAAPAVAPPLPAPVLQAAPQQPAFTPPAQNGPDFQVTPPAKQAKPLAQPSNAAAKQEAQQRAYQASPEGQIARSVAGQQDALAAQGDIAMAAGEVGAAEADDKQAILDNRNVDLQQLQMDQEKVQRDREQGLQKLQQQHAKLVKAESDYKVDRGRMWANASTGSKVLAGIAVAMTALGDALQYKSGPNMALKIITDAIDTDVNDQVREFGDLGSKVNRARSSLDAYMKETGDLVAAKQMLQAQRRQQAADMLEQSAAKFENPKAKLQAAQSAAVLRQESEKLLGQSAEGRFGRDMQREQMANARAQTGLGYANLAQSKLEFTENMKLANRKLLLEAAQLDQVGRAAEAKAKRDEASLAQERGIGGKIAQGADASGNPTVEYGYLVNKDGSTFAAPTVDEAKEMRAQKAAVDTINQFVNDLARGIEEHGGEAEFFKSKAWQEMKATHTSIANELRVANKMGTLDKGSMETIQGMMGGVDPASYWQDARAGLIAARDNTIKKFNNNLRSMNYTGADYKPPDTSKLAAPTETSGNTLQKTALTPAWDMSPEAFSSTTGIDPSVDSPLTAMKKYEGALVGKILPAQKQALDAMYALSKSTDPKIAAEYKARLDAIANSKTGDANSIEYAKTLATAGSR